MPPGTVVATLTLKYFIRFLDSFVQTLGKLWKKKKKENKKKKTPNYSVAGNKTAV